MSFPIIQVDAFSSTPFRGNPAAVCVLSGPRDARGMQDVAREMNLSETAFLHPQDDGYGLRWFTPAVEVDLCIKRRAEIRREERGVVRVRLAGDRVILGGQAVTVLRGDLTAA